MSARGVPSSVQPTKEVQILTVVRWWISCLLWHSEITFGIPSGNPRFLLRTPLRTTANTLKLNFFFRHLLYSLHYSGIVRTGQNHRKNRTTKTTSNCDVTSRANQIQMTTIWSLPKNPPWKFSAYATERDSILNCYPKWMIQNKKMKQHKGILNLYLKLFYRTQLTWERP